MVDTTRTLSWKVRCLQGIVLIVLAIVLGLLIGYIIASAAATDRSKVSIPSRAWFAI